MTYYCSVADVGLRLGLDSAQRSRATNRITSCIRRASIKIDQCFLDYGRDEPSGVIQETTLSAAFDLSTDSTQFRVASFIGFDSSGGKGNINGDTFTYTSLQNVGGSHYIQGVTGLSFDHESGETVQYGEMAHVVREICADIATGIYLEDEATHQKSDDMRGYNMRERGYMALQRLAHLGSA
jgi:hypothetical protein